MINKKPVSASLSKICSYKITDKEDGPYSFSYSFIQLFAFQQLNIMPASWCASDQYKGVIKGKMRFLRSLRDYNRDIRYM